MKTPTTMLHLAAADVRRALPMREAIAAMRDAFAQLARGEVTLPPRLRLDAPGEQGVALVMPCHSAAQKLFALKFITLFGRNPQQGLPVIQSTVMLADGTTGEPLAVMDGASLTALRTGAASGLATDLLARPDATTVAIVGSGVQARTQLEAVACVRRIERAWVFDSLPESAARFAAEMQQQLGLPIVVATSPAAALAEADIICAATTAAAPVFDDRDVRPGTHLNAIGVFHPDRAEVPAATVCRARVVVDHLASAMEEAGDLLLPLRASLIDEAHFRTELGQLVLGQKPGRTAADEITFFKSVGVAIQDLCAAARALANARELGLGPALNR